MITLNRTEWEPERSYGCKPGNIRASVSDYSEITEPGVYAVDGVDQPVAVEKVTPYGASQLSDQGYHVERGMSFIPFGRFVE